MLERLKVIATRDVEVVVEKDKEYGSSWKRRGGVGAFMMMARKWDRIETRVEQDPEKHPRLPKWDIFNHAVYDNREEGILDDIRDLRRYLLLIEDEILQQQPGATGTINITASRVDPTGENHPFGFDAEEDA